MDEKLALTDEHEIKIRALLTKKMEAKEAQKAQRREHKQEMKSILTPEQWTKLEAMKQERKASKKGKKK